MINLKRIFKSYKQAYGYIKWRLFRPAKWRFKCMHNLMNKQYMKEDLTKDYVPSKVAHNILYDPNIKHFRTLDSLQRRGQVNPLVSRKGPGGDVYYSTEDIKEELLRRECACWKDYALYRKELYARPRHKKIRLKNRQAKYEIIALILNGKEYTLGKYNSKMVPKLDRIIKDIYDHQEFFNPDNPNGLSPFWLSYVGKKIKLPNVDTFDVMAELQAFKKKKECKR